MNQEIETGYPHLFSPGKIGKMAVPNRLIMAPMATNFGLEDGGVSSRQIAYYVERARGGTGLIIVENANIDYPLGRNGAIQLRIDDDRYLPGLARLVEAIHEARCGVKVALQLNHAGATTRAARIGGQQPVAPSDVPVSATGEVPRPLTIPEIERIAVCFAQGAARAKRAGFDAIELHGGYSYLLAEFISPSTNHRNDDFGGSLENRLRFPVMVVREIRKAVGSEFPILFRMNADEFIPGGLTLEEAIQAARILQEASVDLIDVTAGNARSANRYLEPISFPEGWRTYLAKAIKEAVDILVSTGGVIRHPINAEKYIASGCADFVAIGRGLIADPHWAVKARQGKEKEIRPCISCNVCVSRRIFEDLPVRCAVNPLAGHEGEDRPLSTQTTRRKKVMVVGGGPAGIYASILLKKLGHDVSLFEQHGELGGKLRIAKVPPGKDKIAWLLQYLLYELEATRVEVHLGVQVGPDNVKASGFEVVVLATGSEPLVPPIAGVSSPFVFTVRELLEGKSPISGENVVLIGGGSVGCECAEYLVAAGNKVTVVEMFPDLVRDLDPISRSDLVGRLQEQGVVFKTNSRVMEIRDGCVSLGGAAEGNGEVSESIPAGKVVLAVGAAPRDQLVRELGDVAGEFYAIGDCVKPGRIGDALRQALLLAKELA